MLAALALSILAIAVDGDTVELCTEGREICERVRIANLETPEIFRPGCPWERTAGESARAYAQALLDDAHDVAIVRREGRSHGRTVSRLSLDGADFGEAMVAAGQGVPYDPDHDPDWCGLGD